MRSEHCWLKSGFVWNIRTTSVDNILQEEKTKQASLNHRVKESLNISNHNLCKISYNIEDISTSQRKEVNLYIAFLACNLVSRVTLLSTNRKHFHGVRKERKIKSRRSSLATNNIVASNWKARGVASTTKLILNKMQLIRIFLLPYIYQKLKKRITVEVNVLLYL